MQLNRTSLVIAFNLLIAAGAACGTEVASQTLLITDVVLVSPERATVSERVNALIRDGRIAAIGPAVSADPNRSRQIAGNGRYLTPGLIDGHTHLEEIPGMTSDQEKAFPDISQAAREQIPRSYLYHGFTTVVDLNSRPQVIAEWNAREVRPHAYFCGGAPVVDGYPMMFMPKPARYRIVPYFLFDSSRPDDFPAGFNPAEHTPEAVAARIKNDGGICIKTHFESGFGGRGDWPVPPAELVRSLVAAAHERGMPVLLHANSQSAQAFGLETGVDAFAHGMWTWDDRTATQLYPDVTRVLDKIIERRIAWQPTMRVLHGDRDLHNPDYLSDARLQQVLPLSLIDWYATGEGQWWRERMAALPYLAELLAKRRWQDVDAEAIARVTAALSYLAAHGGHLVFGSDTPSGPVFSNPPGLNGRLEMERWAQAGVGAAQLFRAATLVNAQFFGLANHLGTVETGKRADLLLMTKNPMKDSDAYDSIEMVILGGRVFDRTELAAK